MDFLDFYLFAQDIQLSMCYADYNMVRSFVIDGDGHDYMKLVDMAQKM